MGYTVLYIAFGAVALWLLGEVLLQNKARLRWRVLAFAGFLCVAVGVVSAQVLVIVAGALAFGAGQTLVTLSHRRGFVTGWALGARPRTGRRRDRAAVGHGDGAADDPDGEVGPDPQATVPPAAEDAAPADDAWDAFGGGPAEPEPAGRSAASPSAAEPDRDPAYDVPAGATAPGAQEYAAAGSSDWPGAADPAAGYGYDDDVFAAGGVRQAAGPGWAAGYDPSGLPDQGYGYDPRAPQDPGYGQHPGYAAREGGYAAQAPGYPPDPGHPSDPGYGTAGSGYGGYPEQEYAGHQRPGHLQDPQQPYPAYQDSYGAQDPYTASDPYGGQGG